MEKLEMELKRLDGFLIQLDKVILRSLSKEELDTQDLSTLMGVRVDLLKRIDQIHTHQSKTKMWEQYSRNKKY